MIHKIISFAWVIVFAQALQAGGGGSVAGNGGDVLVCDSGEVQFFDIFENEVMRGLKIEMGPATLPALTKVEMVIDRLPMPLMFWKSMLLERLELFQQRSVIGDFDLVDIPDSDNIVLKPGCNLQQAVIQRPVVVPNEPIFYISQKFWSKMDENSKAALILHEIIYFDAITQGHANSRVTRALNGDLMSGVTDANICQVTGTLLANGLSSFIERLLFHDLTIETRHAHLDANCRLQNGSVADGTVAFPKEKLKITPKQVMGISLKAPYDFQKITFEQNYTMPVKGLMLTLANPGFIAMEEQEIIGTAVASASVPLFAQAIQVQGEIRFTKGSNSVEEIKFADRGEILIQGQMISVSKIVKSISEEPTYIVKITEGKSYQFTNKNGEPITVDSSQNLYLNADGSVR